MTDQLQIISPSLTGEDKVARENELISNTKPTPFSLKAKMLAQGRTDTVLAATENLTVRLKVYASGGENEIHAHPYEDHSFIILQGSAKFFGPENEQIELSQYQGIMLPKGNLYKFFATSDEPLVMIRVGNPAHKNMKFPTRINQKGVEMKGDSKENKKEEVIYKNQYFGE